MKARSKAHAKKSTADLVRELVANKRGYPFDYVHMGDLQLKYSDDSKIRGIAPRHRSGKTIRVDMLPQNSGRTLQELKDIVDGNNMDIHTLKIGKWAILNSKNQLEKAYELGFVPNGIVYPEHVPRNLEELRALITRLPVETLNYKTSKANMNASEVQNLVMGLHAGNRLRQHGHNSSFIATSKFRQHGVGKRQSNNRKALNELSNPRKRDSGLNNQNRTAIKHLKREESMSDLSNNAILKILLDRATAGVRFLTHRGLQVAAHSSGVDGTEFANNILNDVKVLRLSLNPKAQIWKRNTLLQQFVNQLSNRLSDSVIKVSGLKGEDASSLKGVTVLSSAGRPLVVVKIGKNVPRHRLQDYQGDPVTASTRGNARVALPRRPPATISLVNTDRKQIWKFAGRPDARKTHQGEDQTVKFANESGGVIFSITYDKNGARDVFLNSLYYGQPKQKGGVPARAVVNTLKRMETRQGLGLRNASFVPIPGTSKTVARAILPARFDLYTGLKPDPGSLPELAGIRTVTNALLRGEKLKRSRVDTLLPGAAANARRKIANASGKAHTMEALHNLLHPMGMTNYSESVPAQWIRRTMPL